MGSRVVSSYQRTYLSLLKLFLWVLTQHLPLLFFGLIICLWCVTVREIWMNHSLNLTNVFSLSSLGDLHLSNCKAISNDWLDLLKMRACLSLWHSLDKRKIPWTGHQVTLTIPSRSLSRGQFTGSDLPNVHVFTLWEETGLPRANPVCKLDGNQHRTFLLQGTLQ